MGVAGDTAAARYGPGTAAMKKDNIIAIINGRFTGFIKRHSFLLAVLV